jgi:hypothetical protein
MMIIIITQFESLMLMKFNKKEQNSKRNIIWLGARGVRRGHGNTINGEEAGKINVNWIYLFFFYFLFFVCKL